MYSRVSARPVEALKAEFHQKRKDGTIAAQRPDGREIVASVARARVDEGGTGRWSEPCFCATTLQHERETINDRYFTELHTEAVEDDEETKGQPFMEVLARSASK